MKEQLFPSKGSRSLTEDGLTPLVKAFCSSFFHAKHVGWF